VSRLMLGSGATANYLARALPWIERVDRHSVGHNFFLCVDFDPPEELALRYPNVRFVRFDMASDRAPNPNFCLQHGSFLDAAGAEQDDVVVFTDGDAFLQRPFTEAEIAWLGGVPRDVVALQWNAGLADNLFFEAQRIDPRTPLEEMDEVTLRVWEALPCYNTGVFVARGGTYRRVYAEYCRRHDAIVAAFGHYARQQWLLSYVVGVCGFSVWRLPVSFHAHGHYGMPEGCREEDGMILFRDEPVAFRHML